VENRYRDSSIVNGSKKLEPDGNVRMVSRLSTQFDPSLDTGDDAVIVSSIGDRLDIYAKEYYGDETFWFVIARSNNLGKGTLNVPPGKIVRIPRYAEYSGISAIINAYNDER
jgi:hypothetical protein